MLLSTEDDRVLLPINFFCFIFSPFLDSMRVFSREGSFCMYLENSGILLKICRIRRFR